MVLCLQETHLQNPPTIDQLIKFNLNIAHSVHGILTSIEKTIKINTTKNYTNDKVELIATNLYAERSILIFNIYVAPLTPISIIIQTIALATMESMQNDSVFIIIGDFNINIRANNQNSNLLQQYM